VVIDARVYSNTQRWEEMTKEEEKKKGMGKEGVVHNKLLCLKCQ
jgi:hypothetical protein